MILKLLGENMAEDKSWKDYVFEVPIDAKRTYRYEKDHSHDMSYENERNMIMFIHLLTTSMVKKKL